jgi:hypothetical protein
VASIFYYFFCVLVPAARRKHAREGKSKFPSTEPLPSPSLSQISLRADPVAGRSSPAPADPLHKSLSPAPAPPDSVVSQISLRVFRRLSNFSPCRSRRRQILSTNLSLQRPLPQIPSSGVPAPADPALSLSGARSPRFAVLSRRPASALLFAVLSRRPASSVVRQISSQSSSVSGRSSLRRAGFFFFFFFFFLFCCYILFEILIWGFFVLFLFWLLRELWFCSFVVLLCILLYYNFWVVFPLHTRCLIKCSTEHVVDFRGFGLIYWLRTRNYE